jgi:hypothetical protein
MMVLLVEMVSRKHQKKSLVVFVKRKRMPARGKDTGKPPAKELIRKYDFFADVLKRGGFSCRLLVIISSVESIIQDINDLNPRVRNSERVLRRTGLAFPDILTLSFQ